MNIKKIYTLVAIFMMSVSVWGYDVIVDGIYYNIDSEAKTAEVTFKDESSSAYSGDVTIPETIVSNGQSYSVKSIGRGAFKGCTSLSSVAIPKTIKTIGSEAFSSCSMLKSATIPNSVNSLGENIFYECKALATVIIGNSVPAIPKKAFYNCSSLSKVSMGNAVTSIGMEAFVGCNSLVSITLGNYVRTIDYHAFWNCAKLSSVTLPKSLTSIGNGVFGGCVSLTSITIPASVTAVMDRAFYNCRNLASISLGNAVASIGQEAFHGCSGLKKIIIGNGIKNIYSEAFSGCSAIVSITCAATEVPSTNTTTFKDANIHLATLIVPQASLEAYKKATPWSEFGTFKAIEDTEAPKPKCAKPTIAYSDRKLIYSSDTQDADIMSEVVVSDSRKSNTKEVTLEATYEITAYATKSGYENSDTASATLVWATVSSSTSIEELSVSGEASKTTVDALPLLITQQEGMLTVQGLLDGDLVTAYSVDGREITRSKAIGDSTLLNLSVLQGQIAILSVSGRTCRVLVK